MPLFLDTAKEEKQSKTLSQFSFLPCLGIAFYRLNAWAVIPLESGTKWVEPYVLEIAAQMIAVLLLMLFDNRARYSARTMRTVIILAVALMTIGALIIFSSSYIPAISSGSKGLIDFGFILRGFGSGALLLGFGRYVCSIPPKYSILYIAAGGTLFGIFTQILPILPLDAFNTVAVMLPLASCFCLLSSLERLMTLPEARMTEEPFNAHGFPFDLFFLLIFCVFASTLVRIITPADTLFESAVYGIVWPVIYALIFLVFLFWVLVLKRDNPDILLPILMLVIFLGLFFFSSFQAINFDLATSFMYATRRTISIFSWVFLATTIYRFNLSRILYFGFGNILLAQIPSIVSHFFSQAGTSVQLQNADLVRNIIITIMAVTLVLATVLVIFRRQRTVETTKVSDADEAVRLLAKQYRLSPREAEVTLLLARGYTLPQISKALFISLDTVRSHSKNIYRKLAIHKKEELVELIEQSSM